MNLCSLIPLIVGVIAAILGYAIGRISKPSNTQPSTGLESHKRRISQLESELYNCNSRLAKLIHSRSSSTSLDQATSIFGRKIKTNDLTIIEGVGPKIQKLFHKEGIFTWKKMATTSVAKCQEILDNEGKRFSIHNPGTWPKQALLAYEGKWKELSEWQEKLKYGKNQPMNGENNVWN